MTNLSRPPLCAGSSGDRAGGYGPPGRGFDSFPAHMDMGIMKLDDEWIGSRIHFCLFDKSCRNHHKEFGMPIRLYVFSKVLRKGIYVGFTG